MPIRLFYRTTLEGADNIPREGFRAGPRGEVWLSRYLDAWGEEGRHLLEVVLDVDEAELEDFGKDAVFDDDYDPVTGQWTPTPEGGYMMRLRCFEVPVELVNANGFVREVVPRSIEFEDK